jgi:hypothetical protein
LGKKWEKKSGGEEKIVQHSWITIGN